MTTILLKMDPVHGDVNGLAEFIYLEAPKSLKNKIKKCAELIKKEKLSAIEFYIAGEILLTYSDFSEVVDMKLGGKVYYSSYERSDAANSITKTDIQSCIDNGDIELARYETTTVVVDEDSISFKSRPKNGSESEVSESLTMPISMLDNTERYTFSCY